MVLVALLVAKTNLHSNSPPEERFWYKMEFFQEIENLFFFLFFDE